MINTSKAIFSNVISMCSAMLNGLFLFNLKPMIIRLSLLCSLSLQIYTSASAQKSTPPFSLNNYKQTHLINKTEVQQKAQQIIKKIEQQTMTTPTLPNIHLSIYPMNTATLTPGKVTRRTINVNLPKPLFIISFDQQSNS